MIHLTARDLRHDGLTFGFSVVSSAVLIFAFLLLIPLSMAIRRFGETAGPPQNLYVLEKDALQPEESRIEPGLSDQVAAILGERLDRLDPVVFRILRIEEHPMQLRGVAVESWGPTFQLELIDGAWPSDPAEIVIGQAAAQAGGWRAGSDIEIYGQEFRVAGIADGQGTKAQTIWMSFAAARALFGPERGPQLLVAHLKPSADPLEARQDLEDGLNSLGTGYEPYFEDGLLREAGAALNDLRSLSILTALIGFAAVTIGSSNLAWLAAEERRRWLGILRAVGFARHDLARYFLLRAAVISVAAYLLALAAAAAFLSSGVTPQSLAIGGLEPGLSLTPATAALGLALASLATLAGTWLSVRRVLASSPSLMLGRGPGSTFA